ncbi:expressed unknown protein [Seminavis robusta]|uniref:Uncharacterized protein n=1 Tax=Seminavis robusta TaxID=568900 RepID=A0A9N8H3K7_9STRA|nr:expressed unknown protein [Seminavis robusta]|eukprot:Sro89_g047130.1 n/a (104) ;mRNA; r:112809-113120
MTQPNNSKMMAGHGRPEATSEAHELTLRSAMAPSVQGSNAAAELREYQPQTTGISLGDLAVHGIFNCGALPPPPPEDDRRMLNLEQLQGTIQFVLDMVAEDDF